MGTADHQAVCGAKNREPRIHFDNQVQAWISDPELEGNPLATAPFSRGGKDWRVAQPRKYTYTGNDRALKQLVADQKPIMKYYTPRGERSTWSQAQYTVYKEEKMITREERWAARRPTLDAIAKDVNHRTSSKYRSITDGNRSRTVLGEVTGRKNGQPAVEKDENGIPIVEKVGVEMEDSKSDEEISSEEEEQVAVEGKNKTVSLAKKKSASPKETSKTVDGRLSTNSKTAGVKSQSRKRAHVTESEESEQEDAAPVRKATRSSKRTKDINDRAKTKKTESADKWVVPDSSEESADEHEYMRGQGLTIIHDYWPSPWRVMAAAFVNTERINKSVSLVFGHGSWLTL